MSDISSQMGSSIGALMEEYNTIAHNLANINTTGYKRIVNTFSNELMKSLNRPSSENTEVSFPGGKIDIKSGLDFSQGSMLMTNRTLDLAISGKGFFVIETPDGPVYSRNGVFHVNTQGQLVNLDGRIVAGQDGPIVIPGGVSEQAINISGDGDVAVGDAHIGRLKVVDFGEDEGGVVSIGGNSYAGPEGVVPVAAEKAMIRQGYKENSNVEMVSEMVSLISVSRLYETSMKILTRDYDNAKVILGVANS